MKKKTLFYPVAIIVGVIFAFVLGEIAIRTYWYFRPLSRNGRIIIDEKLGWKACWNSSYYGKEVDAAGAEYLVDYKTNEHGFRFYGDIEQPQDGKKKKVFFVGDSFTQAVAVANDKTYYGLLKNDMPLDVFAYGTGGYGTLQEFMIIDQYIDKICPNVIILQFCSNDFVDNSYALEINSRWSSGICRPYLSKQGEIFYAMPKQLSTLRTLREFTNKYSSLLYLLISRIDILMANVFGTTEDVIAERGKSFDLFRESIDITDTLFKRIKERIPTGTSLYVFTVDDANPYYDELKYLLGKNDIAFIDGVPQAIREAEIAGIVVRAKDKAHWNEMGHQIAARVLKRYLTEKIINN